MLRLTLQLATGQVRLCKHSMAGSYQCKFFQLASVADAHLHSVCWCCYCRCFPPAKQSL
jgi:hypothetical protein